MRWTAWYNEKAFNEETMNLAMKAGCSEFSFSPDAFSNDSLRGLRKNISVEDIRAVFSLIRRTPGAKASHNFFMNPPGQRMIDLLRLIHFFIVAKAFARKSVDGFSLGKIRIEPHSEIARLAISQGSLAPDTSLFAATSDELKKLFYSDASFPIADRFMDWYVFLRNLKQRLLPEGSPET